MCAGVRPRCHSVSHSDADHLPWTGLQEARTRDRSCNYALTVKRQARRVISPIPGNCAARRPAQPSQPPGRRPWRRPRATSTSSVPREGAQSTTLAGNNHQINVRLNDAPEPRPANSGAMHVSDPRREPMLERAMPVDALPGSTIPERTEAQVQLQDGSWIWCEVIGQRKDRQGRWCLGIRWYASPSVGGREGWYVLDDSRIRRFSTLTSGRLRPCGTGPRLAPLGHRAGYCSIQAKDGGGGLAVLLDLGAGAPVLAVAGTADKQLVAVVVGDEDDPQLVVEHGQSGSGLARLALDLSLWAPASRFERLTSEQRVGGVVSNICKCINPGLDREERDCGSELAQLASHLFALLPVFTVPGVRRE